MRLEDDHYSVVFPEPGTDDPGVRTADFTYDVWIDARSGAVVKVLTSS